MKQRYISKGLRGAVRLLHFGAVAGLWVSATAVAPASAKEPIANPTAAAVIARRARSLLDLDQGQLEIQNEMYEYAESWYDLSYVRNSTPASEDRSDPYMNTRPGFACRESDVRLIDNIDEFPLFATIPPNIYAGSIIKGDTLLTNTYGVFSGPRNSAKIVINVPYTNGPYGTETMPAISQAEYLEALRRILKSGIGKVPSSTAFSIERIFSQDQLAFAMKANVSGKSFDVSAQFSIDSTSSHQYALVSVTQLFFRVYLDRPDYGAQFFAKNLTPQDVDFIKREMTVYNPPLYVSAIDYGRKAYILFETSDSSLDIAATVTAGYKGVVEADGEVNLEVKQALESMTANGFVIGGSSTLGANTIAELFSGSSEDGFDALGGVRQWLITGAEPSDQNPPAALGYEIALLLDGSKALARTTTEYKEVDCDVGVCPSGFFWGKKYGASWFEINVRPQPRIYPAAALIGDTIDIEDGNFYTYTFPLCNRIYWRNVSLQCVANERNDFVAGESPPGVWEWRNHPNGNKREISTDVNCFDWNAEQENATARRIDIDGGPPIPLDNGDDGYAKKPADYWRWRK